MAKKLPIQTEYESQVSIIAWAKIMERHWPELGYLHASLSGVRLPVGLAQKMKKAGNKKGVPDLCLPVVRLPYYGLWIELKRERGGRVSDEQKGWLQYLTNQGYYAIVCRGKDEAIKTILNYLQEGAQP